MSQSDFSFSQKYIRNDPSLLNTALSIAPISLTWTETSLNGVVFSLTKDVQDFNFISDNILTIQLSSLWIVV